MKICFACDSVFDYDKWQCPDCQWVPPLIEGYHAFAPELAMVNDGIPADTHHFLDQQQEKSFWFRGRNQLIQSVIKQYFAEAGDVMEIGCGSGYVLSGIRAVLPNARLTATEIYSYGLSYAAQRVSLPSQFLQVDARKLPFRDEFDLVGAFDVLEHIEEDAMVIASIRNSLKSGGGLIVTVPQHPWLWSKADDLACHKRRYTRTQLSALLKQNEFDILMDTSFMFFLLPLIMAQRILAARHESYEFSRELSLPAIVDKSFEAVLKLERLAISAGLRFPIGGSRLVVARKL